MPSKVHFEARCPTQGYIVMTSTLIHSSEQELASQGMAQYYLYSICIVKTDSTSTDLLIQILGILNIDKAISPQGPFCSCCGSNHMIFIWQMEFSQMSRKCRCSNVQFFLLNTLHDLHQQMVFPQLQWNYIFKFESSKAAEQLLNLPRYEPFLTFCEELILCLKNEL